MLQRFLENLLESGTLFCIATAATKTALGIIQVWFNYFRGILACTLLGRLSKDAAVVGSFIPVFLFVYGDDQFANISAPFQNAMLLDTHESVKPSSIPSSPLFTIKLFAIRFLAFFSVPNSPLIHYQTVRN